MLAKNQKKRKGMLRPTCRGNDFAVGNKGGRPKKWTEDPKNYFFTSFLTERQLHPQQVERFAEQSEEFCEAYARAKLVQECRLVEMAIFRKGDPGFIKFILKNKAGWKEKNEVSGNTENPLAVIMERIAERAKHPLEDKY